MAQDQTPNRPNSVAGTVALGIAFYAVAVPVFVWLLLDWLPFYLGGFKP